MQIEVQALSIIMIWLGLVFALQDPISRGVVMYDLVNEPDNRKIFWRVSLLLIC